MRALVPLTTDRHLFVPTTPAHSFSNWFTREALDHIPLRRSSTTIFSSVSLFQMGHPGQPFVRIGFPPSTAGTVALPPPVNAGPPSMGEGPAAESTGGTNKAPAAKRPVLRRKALRLLSD